MRVRLRMQYLEERVKTGKKKKEEDGSCETINNSVSLAVNCQIKKRTKMPSIDIIVRGYLR